MVIFDSSVPKVDLATRPDRLGSSYSADCTKVGSGVLQSLPPSTPWLDARSNHKSAKAKGNYDQSRGTPRTRQGGAIMIPGGIMES